MSEDLKKKSAEDLSTEMAAEINKMAALEQECQNLYAEESSLRSLRTGLDNRKIAVQRRIKELTEEIHRRAGIREKV